MRLLIIPSAVKEPSSNPGSKRLQCWLRKINRLLFCRYLSADAALFPSQAAKEGVKGHGFASKTSEVSTKEAWIDYTQNVSHLVWLVVLLFPSLIGQKCFSPVCFSVLLAKFLMHPWKSLYEYLQLATVGVWVNLIQDGHHSKANLANT